MFGPNGPTLFELLKQGFSSMKDGYDQIAPKFDLTPFLSKPEVLKTVTECLRTRRAYDNAIDLCTGTGAGVEALAPIVRNRIVGVDQSALMLAEANRKFKSNGSVRFVRDDVLAIRYRNAFDLATCFGAFGHFDRPQRREFISVAHSALKPGGNLVIDAFSLPLYAPTLWILFAFDAVMHVRNIFVRPPFYMYYLHWLLPAVLPLFDRTRWASVMIEPVSIKGKPSPVSLIVATKR